jgi:hypothetical protein
MVDKFTPGPWEQVQTGIYADDVQVAYTVFQNKEANARLIAAAPDLFTAARAVVERWDTPAWTDAEPTAVFINELRKAIRKATTDV